jgi:hypothetical protein
MSEINNIQEHKTAQMKKLERRLGALGWGLFFIWIGVAFLVDVGWGVGLLGVGINTIGIQVTRTYSGLKWDRFWTSVGCLFFLAGIWVLLDVQLDLPPILCIGVGVALLVSMLGSKARNHKCGQSPTLSEIKGERNE